MNIENIENIDHIKIFCTITKNNFLLISILYIVSRTCLKIWKICIHAQHVQRDPSSRKLAQFFNYLGNMLKKSVKLELFFSILKKMLKKHAQAWVCFQEDWSPWRCTCCKWMFAAVFNVDLEDCSEFVETILNEAERALKPSYETNSPPC